MIDVTSKFLDYYLPDTESILFSDKGIPYANNVIFRSMILFGFPGSGKTTAANSIAGWAVEKYGEEQVNARISEDGSLTNLHQGLRDSLVNILFSDNTTLAKQDSIAIQDHFKLRNIFANQFQKRNGYIFSIIALHRYHGIPVELRSCIDGILIRDISLNPYDRTILKDFIDDDEMFEVATNLTDERITDKDLLNINIYIGRTIKGIVILNPSDKFYFKESVDTNNKLKEFLKTWMK